jgi:hypothetical protein
MQKLKHYEQTLEIKADLTDAFNNVAQLQRQKAKSKKANLKTVFE